MDKEEAKSCLAIFKSHTKMKEICEKMESLVKSYDELQARINRSKENDVFANYLDYFIPLLQDISKRTYAEYFRLIDVMITVDNEIKSKHKKINDEIVDLMNKQAKRDGQKILGLFNHPDEIKHDEIIETIKSESAGFAVPNGIELKSDE